MTKRSYATPRLTVHGTVKQITKGIKELKAPSDGNYLGDKGNPLNGSCTCIDC